MPQAAVDAIGHVRNRNFFFPSIEDRNQSDDLLMAHSRLLHKLIVAYAGIVLPYPNDPVHHKLAVGPTVKGKIIFFEFLRRR